MGSKTLRILVTIGAVALIILRMQFPDVPVDNTILFLSALAVFPWLAGVFRSIELPNGYKIEMQELNSVSNVISKSNKNSKNLEPITDEIKRSKPSFLRLSDSDPNLALVGLRIEIEAKLKSLAHSFDISSNSLRIIASGLCDKGVFSQETSDALQRLIELGNKAAHGAELETEAFKWVFENGPRILSSLHIIVEKELDPNIESSVELSKTILQFEGEDAINMAIDLLEATKKSGTLMLSPGDTLKLRTGRLLIKLGALIDTGQKTGGTWTRYMITPLGSVLPIHLHNMQEEKLSTTKPKLH